MSGVTLRWPDADRIPEPTRSGLIGPGAPFELRDEEVLGVRMPVFAQQPANLREILLAAADRFGDRPYTVFPERSETFRSVLGPVASVAAALRDRYGVGKGDRVAIAAANCPGYALTFWAATALGAITVALNGWWTGPELAYGIELTTPRVVFGDGRRLERLAGVELDVPVVDFDPALEEMEAHAPGAAMPDVPIAPDDPFLILFTSGTTGRPKGALLSHRSNLHFIWSSMLGPTASAAIEGRAFGSAMLPCTINASPMFHVSGLNCQLVMSTVTGQTIVYPPQGKWREDVHLRLTEQHGATTWSLVPTQLWRLLQYEDLERYDLSSLKVVGGGSAVWPPELLRTLERRLPGVRPGLGMGYGMTETNGLGTSLRGSATYEHPDAIGWASPGCEIQVRDPVSDEAAGEDEVGEICIRTAASMIGYWDNPDATKLALDHDRWYHTGDFGHISGGLLYLQGRRRDLIIRGGENIYPAEIENRLLEHPSLSEVAVIGVPHPTLGQEVKAVIVRPDADLTADDVRAWVGAGLAAYKVPTHVEFVDSLPYNPAGKVMKHLLEQPAEASGFVQES